MDFSFEQITFYLIFILPGMISLKIYSWIIPVEKKSHVEILTNALFYASIDIILILPIYFLLVSFEEKLGVSVYLILYALILFISIVSPFLIYKFQKRKFFSKFFQLPFPTSWDYFFSQRETCFMLFHLKDSKKIGGYYGENSYSCSFPSNGDIYIEKVFKINDDGTFGEIITDSKGLIITKDQYNFIELFEVPKNQDYE
jgi:hypothetical protein